MYRYLGIIYLLFSSIGATAQTNRDEIMFLNDFFNRYYKDRKIYFEIGSDNKVKEQTLKTVATGVLKLKFNSGKNMLKIDSVILDPNEIKLITEELHTMNNFNLKSRDLKDGKKLRNNHKVNPVKNAIFTLSKPIIFRNNSLCIFIHTRFCGNRCGSSSSMLYKNVNGNWVPLFFLFYIGY